MTRGKGGEKGKKDGRYMYDVGEFQKEPKATAGYIMSEGVVR